MCVDCRSGSFVFVPFCLFCRAFQARGIVKSDYYSTVKPVLDMLLSNDVNIIQLPCPESSYSGYNNGLSRLPAGLSAYETKEYIEHCLKISHEPIEQIKAIVAKGYVVKAIIGIENSPSCAVNYIYTNKGTVKRSGIFIKILMDELKNTGIEVTFLGLNRRRTKGIIENLKDVL